MENLEEMDLMRTYIHGTDKGNAVFKSLILIILLSSVFISFIGRISVIEQYTLKYKAQVLSSIEQSNMEIMYRYEFH